LVAMAADAAKFSGAIDKVYKNFSTQEVQFDPTEMKGLSNRDAMQYMEKKFQQQLQRARAAFLQEFRNHSVVVESEVRKIREELTEKLEEKYGERISSLKAEAAETAILLQKHREEIAQLKSLVGAQESYLAAVRHRVGLESKERLRSEISQLREDLEAAKQEGSDLNHQLMCRDELVAQLNNELAGVEGQIKRQALAFADERQAHETELMGLRHEMQEQQEHFQAHLKSYQDSFEEYKSKTAAELQIQDILNSRRSEALGHMEEERQRHIQARTKPSRRIGPGGEFESEVEARCANYELAGTQYRVDDMGMATGWRDYQLNDVQLVSPAHPKKGPPPKFRIDRVRRACQRGNLGPNAPIPTETPRETSRPGPQLEVAATPRLPAVLPPAG